MTDSRPRSDELLLSIGGIAGRVVLVGGAATFVEQVKARYAAFTVPSSPLVEVGFTIRVVLGAAPPAAMTAEERAARNAHTESHPLVVKATDKTLRIDRWNLTARLAAKAVRTRGARRTVWAG